MARRGKRPSRLRTPPRKWQPMRRAEMIIRDDVRAAARSDPELAAAIDEAELDAEIWRNDRYVVTVRRDKEAGHVVVLSIRRDDRGHAHDWRHFQWIKNDIAGPEVEAIELYPAESRLVDSANQFWIWCMPPGVRIPLGFNERVVVSEGATPRVPNTKQRPLDDDAAGTDR